MNNITSPTPIHQSNWIDTPDNDIKRVSYLIGAGGSHACVAEEYKPGILMKNLITELAENIKTSIESKSKYYPLRRLVNDMADPEKNINIEHLITFYEESPSALHNEFAMVLRKAFQTVLRKRLNDIKKTLGIKRFGLYKKLFEMHKHNDKKESLRGILTLNYDNFIEEAAKRVLSWNDADLDFCHMGMNSEMRILKLHGSFYWRHNWPLQRRKGRVDTLWIPPGIQKRKDRYPFNILWGMARDVLDCDILRIIGCSLGPSDWDLISLIFSTHHTSFAKSEPYTIEIIDSLRHSDKLKNEYPYLKIKSLFEIKTNKLGPNLISSLMGTDLKNYDDLTSDQKEQLREKNGNWFKLWLDLMLEDLNLEIK